MLKVVEPLLNVLFSFGSDLVTFENTFVRWSIFERADKEIKPIR